MNVGGGCRQALPGAGMSAVGPTTSFRACASHQASLNMQQNTIFQSPELCEDLPANVVDPSMGAIGAHNHCS